MFIKISRILWAKNEIMAYAMVDIFGKPIAVG
jgi:hypothetical protein